MFRTKTNSMIAGLILLLACAAPANAQVGSGYDLRWNTIDCGGQAVAGGTYNLIGVIGQPDAGVHVGSAFALSGGFVPGLLRCAADVDESGQVTPADIAVFVQIWLASLTQGHLAGDFDVNGAVQPADIAAFVSVWFNAVAGGC